MTVQVKICGLKTTETLDEALDAGADFFGLVFFERSPRNLRRDQAARLVQHAAGRAKSVALLVDPSDADVKAVADEVGPDYLQLHGSESPERVSEIKSIAGRPVIKAVKVATAEDAEDAHRYDDAADLVLFDAKAPEGGDAWLPGGNGIAFDWQALAGVKDLGAFILSGGLDPDNVGRAIAETGARVVDVSSGVERAPGEKDPDLVRRFVTAAKSAAAPNGSS
ncbi:MAG: phosphoribosylanthranilate isomerase [Hyphomicrobiales bacterium]|nr:phosphoribosylanthranilate isomerase [Hyphomicrobiales bacterium]